MLKTTAKIILSFILVLLVAVATGVSTYFITTRLMNKDTPPPDETQEANRDTNPTFRQSSVQPEVPKIRYIVQLEGNALGIYVSQDGFREFLYHETIYPENLSPDDSQLLQEGVTFNSVAELTEFVENFTS